MKQFKERGLISFSKRIEKFFLENGLGFCVLKGKEIMDEFRLDFLEKKINLEENVVYFLGSRFLSIKKQKRNQIGC